MNWQKKARLGIVVFVIVFVAIVVVALRYRKPVEREAAAPPRVDPKAVVENIGTGRIEHSKAGNVIFTLKFGSQFTYPDGRSKFGGGVELTADRNGRPFKVSGRDAEIVLNGDELKTAHFTGAVKLTSQGVEVTAEEATYDEAEGMLRIPGPVAFTRGRMNGTGVGATYDRNREVLWLLDQAHVAVTPDAKGQGALDATAGAAGFARADHYIRLSRSGHISAEGRVIDADEITIVLTPAASDSDDERVHMLQLRGNSRIAGGGSASAPQAMSARDIDLTYADDGRTLQTALLMENGAVQLPGDGKSAGRRIEGKTVNIAMAPDGATVTNLSATENVQLDLPAEGDVPARRIRSATLTAQGAPGSGLQNATFAGNVEYRETRAARGETAAVERVARSLTLIVETQPGFGALQQADFHGNVHFTDGPQVAADAQRALYHVDRDRIDLSPSGDPGPAAPRVSDTRVTIEARNIELTLGTRKLTADTKVRSSMQPQRKPGPAAATPAPGAAAAAPAAGGTQEGHIPSLLKQDQAVTVTSNRLEYDGLGGRAIYSGNARLWQKETSVRGDTIIVDDKTGNLDARVNVKTEMMLDDVDSKTQTRKPTRTNGEGDVFVYDDAKRLATYTGKAHLVGAQGDVAAEKLELFLAEGASELERAEGYGENGTVVVKESARTATGARLTYTAKTETYHLTGTPVKVIEIAPSDCKESVGAVLTFQRAVDTFSMAGNGVIRTVQRQIACPVEPR
jgi:lipopolysaccharide export system protein LptA